MVRRFRDSPLQLHLALARRRFWQVQLFRCSVVALVASLAAWLTGLPLPWRLAAMAAGFVGGLAWSARGQKSWALGWIQQQSGLSYHTALELESAAPGADGDRYGFREGVMSKVLEQLRRLEPPALQHWWLPVLTLALGLVLLPAISPGGALLPGPESVVDAPSGSLFAGPQEPLATPEVSRGQDAGTGNPPADGTEADPPDGDALGQLDRAFDNAERTGPNDAMRTPNDGETLSRFLQDLEQRPPEPPQNQQGQGQAQPGGQQGQQPGLNSQQGGADDGRTNQEGVPQPATGGNEPADQGDRQGQDGGQQGDQGQAPPQAAAVPGEGGGGEQQGQPQPGQGQEANMGDAGDGAGTEGQGDAPPGEEQLARGAGEGAGTQGGEAPEGDPSELAEDPQDPEGLEGRFLGGPGTVAGEVLVPGLEDIPLPEGQGPAAFERALEQAITEGRIPVEYQEILREYYR